MWIRLKKKRFPVGSFAKLKPRTDRSFRIIKKLNDNIYNIDLPRDYNISATFNVVDLTPCFEEQEASSDKIEAPLIQEE